MTCGEAWVLDITDVGRWMEARADAAAAAASIPPAQGSDGEDNSKEESNRRKAWAQARREEQRLAEERGQLIRQDDAIAVVAAECLPCFARASIRSTMYGVSWSAARNVSSTAQMLPCCPPAILPVRPSCRSSHRNPRLSDAAWSARLSMGT